MKKTLLYSCAALATLAAFSCSSTPKDGWSVEATLDGSQPGDNVSISYVTKNGEELASADTTITLSSNNQTVSLTEKFIEPAPVVLHYTPKDSLAEPFFVELFINKAGEKLQVKANVKDITSTRISGGMYDNNPSYDTLRGQIERFMGLLKEQRDAFSNSDTTALIAVSQRMGQLQRDYLSSSVNFIRTNPDKGYSVYLLTNLMGALPLDSAKVLFDGLSPEMKTSRQGKEIDQAITQALSRSIREGSDAPEFSVKGLNGKEIKLSDYRGKWVLIDFWGSWCGPCRESNPSLVKLYNQYKSKGFEIIGLAVNDKPENLAKAIKEDGITWPNADLSQDEQAGVIPFLYNIQSVPTKFLVNPEGKIALVETGYDPSANPLAAELAKIFK